MRVQTTNVLKELRRIRRTTVDPRDREYLRQAETWVKYALAEIAERDGVFELERMFRLEDPRGGNLNS